MKDDVFSNTHANRDKRKMKIKDNVISNIQEQKKIQRKKIKDDAIFNTQNSKDKIKMRVKDNAITKQVQIITPSTLKKLITYFLYNFFFKLIIK